MEIKNNEKFKDKYNFNNIPDYILNKFNLENKNEKEFLINIDKIMNKPLFKKVIERLDRELPREILDVDNRYKTEEFDFEKLDDETFTLISAFLGSESDLKDELFENPEIVKFHEEICEVFNPYALIELGKKRIQKIEYGEVKSEDLEVVEAEIVLLFTQIIALRKHLVKTYDNWNKNDNDSGRDMNSVKVLEANMQKEYVMGPGDTKVYTNNQDLYYEEERSTRTR